jgi:hypothetical protein
MRFRHVGLDFAVGSVAAASWPGDLWFIGNLLFEEIEDIWKNASTT